MSLPIAILVGGLATRLRPLTDGIPKALIPVNGRPFLAHQLDLLKTSGITNVVICAWYKGEKVAEYAGSGSQFGLKIRYSYDGEQPLGTGGAIRKALPLLGNAFFVLYGDSYLPIDYSAVEKVFIDSGKDALMTVFQNLDQGDRSNVRFENGEIMVYDKVNRIKEMRHIDYGLGVFKASVFSEYQSGKNFDLACVYQTLLKDERLAAHEVRQRFYGVGSFEGIRDLENYLKKK